MFKQVRWWLLTAVLLTTTLFYPSNMMAQEPLPPSSINFRHISVGDGLPNSHVHRILQDRRGFIWFGTWGGLARYDGYDMVVYQHDSLDETSLGGDRVLAMAEDDEGMIWIASTGAGLSRFDPYSNQFTRYVHDPDDPNSLARNGALSLALDGVGGLWIGGEEGMLDRLDIATGQFQHYQAPECGPRHNITNTLWDNQGNGVWLLHEALVHFDPEAERFTCHRIETPEGEMGRSNQIVQDDSGIIWAVARDDGLFGFDPESETFTRYPTPLPERLVSVSLAGSDGLWLGSNGGTLSHFDLNSKTHDIRNVPDATNSRSLNRAPIITSYQSRDGVVWLGTASSGVSLFDPQQRQFERLLFSSLPFADDVDLGAVTGFYLDEDGVLWLANSNALMALDRAAGTVVRYDVPQRPSRSGRPDVLQVDGLVADANGNLWFDGSNTLMKFDKTTAQLHEISLSSGARPEVIAALVQDEAGHLWVSATTTLYQFDPLAEEVINAYRHEPNNPNSLRSGQLETLYVDRDNNLWISGAGFLTRFDRQRNSFQHYLHDPDDPTSIPSSILRYILMDEAGDLWATMGEGLMRFTPETAVVTRYTTNDGLPSNLVRQLLFDDTGRLWMSSQQNLVRFDPETGDAATYDFTDGLHDVTFNSGGSYVAETGEMFFTGPTGMTSFFPDEVGENGYQPAAFLTDMQLFNESVVVGEESLLPQPVWASDEVTFAYDDEVITLVLASSAYAATDKTYYRYRLNGFEERWNEVKSDHRFVTYTSLPAGDYTFAVQAANEDKVWGDETQLRVVVTPPWWQTWWFRITAVLLLLASIVGGVQWRLRSVEARNRYLEQEVETRTRQVTEQERQLAALAERERIGRALHDDLGQVLGYVNVQSQAALAHMERGQAGQAESVLTQLVTVAQDAHADIREYILGIRGEQLGETFIEALQNYLQKMEANYGMQTQLSLPSHWEKVPFSDEVGAELLSILQEALTNIRKYATTPNARILMIELPLEVQVVIEDEGPGFEITAVKQRERPSFGLNIMRERAEQVGGSLEVRSQVGVNTQIIVRMPRELAATAVAPSDIRTLLVDDHQLYLEGLRNLLSARGLNIVGTAADGLEAQAQAKALQPDLILMDIHMPKCDGLEATQKIKVDFPDMKIVMLTVAAEGELLLQALKHGASGYLLKSLQGEQFFQLLDDVLAGETVLSPDLASRILMEASQQDEEVAKGEDLATVLTSRQIDVLKELAQGRTNKEIAATLSISEPTAKYHVRQILQRLQLRSRHEAAERARKLGLLDTG